MKKLFRTMILALLSVILCLGTFACGGDDTGREAHGNLEGNTVELVVGGGKGYGSIKSDGASGELTIKYLNSGFGSSWLDQVVVGFQAAFPNVKVHLEDSSQAKVIWAEAIGEVYKGVDIYVVESQMHDYIDRLEPLDDVYKSVWGNETKTIGEKIDPRYIEEYKEANGSFYGIPAYAGAYGFIYNSDLISEDEVPVTTDEMVALCQELKDAGNTPLIFSGEQIATYWEYAQASWNAQYDGIEAFYEAQRGKIYDEATGTYKYDESVMYKDSMYEAMKVCESLLWYPKHYIDSQSTGYQYIVAQRNFLNGGYGMMYTGSWTLNEMSKLFPDGYDFDVRMMRIPIISAIRNKCTTIESDAELSALVKAIDKDGKNAPLTGANYDVSQKDFDKIYEARTFVYVGAEGANLCIPKIEGGKVNVQLAKLFLTYMYSDHGICQHTTGKVGCVLPVVDDLSKYIDFSEMNNFYQDSYSILLSSTKLFNLHRGGVFMHSGIAGNNSIESMYGSKDTADRMTAEQAYNKIKSEAHNEYTLAMQQAGLID